VGVGVMVGVGDAIILVGVGVAVGIDMVGVGVINIVGIEICNCDFVATPKTSFFLTASVYEGAKNEGISKESTNKITTINPLFLKIFIFILLIISSIKKSFSYSREGQISSCSGNKINIVF